VFADGDGDGVRGAVEAGIAGETVFHRQHVGADRLRLRGEAADDDRVAGAGRDGDPGQVDPLEVGLRGTVFADGDGDGVRGAVEAGIAGETVFILPAASATPVPLTVST
jgi:hypothetical protein